MREITTHHLNGLNEALQLNVLDEPGAGNACHAYDISWRIGDHMHRVIHVHFQNGPIQEEGVNGISNEVLLAIVRDRLEGFQSGAYACEENARALDMVIGAMESLKNRTSKRVARGVEGTSTL